MAYSQVSDSVAAAYVLSTSPSHGTRRFREQAHTGEVKEFCTRLKLVVHTIETWLKVEKQWLEFHPIFVCEAIRGQMHTEVLLFQEVDQQYQDLMKEVGRGMSVINIAGEQPMLNSLLQMFTILEMINAGVKIYVNKIQFYFPRLFFLSNFEILQMLAETKSTEVIHVHLGKIFNGINYLCYDDSTNEVVAVKSTDGEQINFEQLPQTPRFGGKVEELLSEVEKQMRVSLKVQCKKCLNMYKKESFSEWVVGWPGQAVQCALMTIRTGQIHNCLAQGNCDQLQFVCSNIQNQREVLFTLVQQNLPGRVRVAIEALIILTVHALDFLQLILTMHVVCDTDFNWLVQLRYYQEDIVQIRMLNATLPYGYEYIGNTSRLVMTPLTERCFRTLIGAYHMNLHGAPEGPPETGKTETVRDLAKAVAVYCFSFNCTPSLSHNTIEKFLKGIVGSKAWGCLNDLHKIKLDVMSVVAQQLMSIISTVRSEAPCSTLDGDYASVYTHSYICVTLYPGLSIQSPIPENLKMLFRPVAMMLPDIQIITEVCLYSCGFSNSRDLSLRLLTLQTLCSKQLFQQGRFFCAFGSLKAVLREAVILKRSNLISSEDAILLQAVIDTFTPKLTDDNTYIFNSILADLFVGHENSSPINNRNVTSLAIQVCKDMHLQSGECFVSKIVQIHDALGSYTGVIVVGEPYSGKTSILKVVRKILCINEEDDLETNISPINAKTLTIAQLYGYTDGDSKEWVDGIIPKFFRKSSIKQWLVFDGPMDSSWLDILNTAFDTTHRLCLSSGEIIPISLNISVVFEALHLNEASPATVSRCGVIYTPPHTVGWHGLVHSWLSSSLECQSGYLTNYQTLFHWIIPPTVVFVETKCGIVMKAGRYNMIRTMLLLIEIMLKDACADNEDYSKHLPVWIQSATLLAGVWGFGGLLTPDSREQFDIFFRDIWRGNNESHPIPETIEKLEINIPSEGQLNDYWYHFKGKGAWRFWPEVVRSLKIEEEIPNLQFTMVSTIESAKYLNILEMHVKHQSPLMLVGPTVTGKTFYINKIINKLPLEKFLPISIPFSPNTSAHFFQDFVISKLERKSKKTYRAPGGRTAVLFVDDVNMCSVDVNGVHAPVEVLHQYLDHRQWFQVKNNAMVSVEDLLLLSACGMPGGTKKHICPRVLRHFSLFALSPLSDETITKIYSTLLFTGFKRNGFATDVMPTVMCIVAATADVLLWATHTLHPTPNKPHYAFSMWDYAKLIFSHLLVKRENVDSKKVFIRLWVHESLRVFGDRMVGPEDRAQLTERLRYAVKEYFKESFDASLDNLMPKGQEEIQEDNLRNLVFTTALNSENSEDRKYEEVGSLDQLLKSLTVIIETYNNTHPTPINIVLFRFALEHLSRLCRVLSISGGSCLMLGIRGSGRQTIARLAAILNKAIFSHATIVYNYGFPEWRADLKRVLMQAGGSNTKAVFFVSENELTDDLFLQDIDMILSSGQVPDMFSTSELEVIFEMVRLSAQGGNRNLDINPLTVFAFFVGRCRQNLHIILSLSSISYSFRRWLSLYPSLLNHCTIDWVEPYKTMTFDGKEYKLKDWPEEALEKIAYHYWDGLEIEDSVMASAINLCKYIHVTAREATEMFLYITGKKCYVTSASYLTMVKKYRCLIAVKQQEIVNAKLKFICGLEKLEFATTQVSVIQKDLEALQPQLQVASAETEKMMKVIERETVTIDKASGLVREDEKVAKIQAAAGNNLKIECEADLALAIPILEEAVAALNTLKPTDITLVKSMKNPPDTVKLVMAAVCVMKDIKPEKIPDPNTPGRKILDYWGPSKRLLGDMAFLQQLKDYDKDNIPPAIMSMIRKQYLPNKDFKPHIVAKASSAAEGLCKWVIAMDMYDAVAKEVAPKKVKLEIAEKELAATMAILEEKRAQVRMLEEKLMDLNAKLDAAQQRKKVLENEVGFCEGKLWKAQTLIGGLAGEKNHWTKTASDLQVFYHNLAGDILLSCGVIAYFAPLNHTFRQRLIRDWCKVCSNLEIPKTEDFNFIKVLGFDINIQNWNIYGLPRDEFSIENAVILEYTDRCPLLIDPQGHANRWIKSKEKSNGLQVIRMSDEDYMKSVETSLHNGRPVLLENVEEDLNAIILSPLFVQHKAITLGTSVMSTRNMESGNERRPRIYITTRLQNPAFSPTVFNNLSVMNFTLSLNGLEDKLLDIVIAKERPDLQEKKQTMIISSSENKTKLQQVQNSIIETLSYTKGNILENETAIITLNTAQNLCVKIKETQKQAKIVEEEVHSYCQQYFAIVEHSARLYFCLTNLVNINYMYQFSLNWFLKTYTISIDAANKSQIMEVRLQYLEDRITYDLYKNVCCALFEKHRILFSLLLCTTIDLANKSIHEDDLHFLLNDNKDTVESVTDNPASDWLHDSAWQQILCLNKLPTFSGFASSFVSNHSEWQAVKQNKVIVLPAPWDSHLTNFQKLIIIKIIYPHQMTNYIIKYIKESMGLQYANPPRLDMSSSFEDSNCLTPLLFILCPGADPMAALHQFAKRKQFFNRLHSISLGVNQSETASALVQQCKEEGSWVCLQNCHLAHSYMTTLERLCDSLTLQNTNMEFRLWLTCSPTTQFPMSILQNSVKMTTDLPSGLKQRLMHIFLSEPVCNEEFFYGCPGKDCAFAKLLYSISFLHAWVQERKKYGHMGWNVPYEFTEVDFHICLHQLQMYINEYRDIPYSIVQYVMGECNYGGHLHDVWDRRLLNTLVSNLINIRVAETPNYCLFPVSDRFQVPLRFEYHDFISSIQELPDNATAEVFGLNYNAEICYNHGVTQELVETLQLLKPSTLRSKYSYKNSTISIADSIITKLSGEVSLEAEASTSGLELVLAQECQLYNNLLSTIQTSLHAFKAAFMGLSEMSDDLEQLGLQMEKNQIPCSWLKVSYATCKTLGSYIEDLINRLAYIKTCCCTGFQQEVWLPGLYCPQALLIAALNRHSRLSQVPFHMLSFDHTVLTADTTATDQSGIVVSGLYIQGASWDHSLSILEEQPLWKFFSSMSKIWFKPSLKEDINKESKYRCPVYSTAARNDYITDVLLCTGTSSSHWVYCGVILLCQVEP